MITPLTAKAVLYFDGFGLGVFVMFWLVLSIREGSAPIGALVVRNFMGGAVLLVQVIIAYFFVSPGLNPVAFRAITTLPSWLGSSSSPVDAFKVAYSGENVLHYAAWMIAGVLTLSLIHI